MAELNASDDHIGGPVVPKSLPTPHPQSELQALPTSIKVNHCPAYGLLCIAIPHNTCQLQELMAGGAAGGLAKTCVAPLERVKIFYQTGQMQGQGVWSTLKTVWGTEGISGLFRGNGASVLRIVPYAAIHYSAYEQYRSAVLAAAPRLKLMPAQLQQPSQRVSPLVDMLAGSAAGATSVLVTYPLDLVRTRLAYQTSDLYKCSSRADSSTAPVRAPANGHAGQFNSAGGSAAQTARPGAGQLSGSKRAFGSMCATVPASRQLRGAQLRLPAMPSVSCREAATGSSSSSSKRMRGPASAAAWRASMRSSGLQTSAAPVIAMQYVHWRCPAACSRLASSSTASRHAPLATSGKATIRAVLRQVVQQEGLLGLYRGIGPTLAGILPYAGLKFYVYQSMKQSYALYVELHDSQHPHLGETARLPVLVMLAFGASAGLVAQTVTYPLDVVRRRMQVQGLKLSPAQQMQQLHSGPAPVIHSTWHGLRSIFQTQGWRALYAGLSINYMKVVPSTAIGFTLYDAAKTYLGLPNHL